MTAKEKAKELVNKFIEHTQEWDELDGYVNDIYRAKQCALIEIDGRIEEVEHWLPRVIFLNEVKQEIQNL
jgi:hypothetical protein